jgi:hypothetical protein
MNVVEKVVATVKPTASRTTAKKTAAKPASKPLAKVAVKAKKTVAPAKPATRKPAAKAIVMPVVKVAEPNSAKLKKTKMVRDSFTFPKAEYAVLDGLKMRAAKLGSPAKKTELLRAGIKAIAAMQDAAFVAALKSVPSLKTGRPAKQN